MAGRYNKYADYKSSNNAWLGDIPSNWRTMSLRHFVSSLKNGSTETQVDYGADTVPVSRIETISKGTIDIAKVGYVDKNSISESFRLESGDLLLSHINSLAMVGNVAQVESSHFLYHGMNLLRLIPSKTVSSDYLFWQLKSSYCRSLIESVAKPAINQASVSTESLKSLQLLYPSIDEQIAISNFLGHETAKIDILIAKQEKLIELLKEKRQAVISHAVTKGLNPNAPMKDSGVEWLGDVPEHWVVTKIKHITSVFEQGWSPQCDSRPADSHEYGVLKVGCVNGGYFNSSENKALPQDLEPKLNYRIRKGDLLISRANTKELVGSAAVVDRDYDSLLLCDKLYRLTFSSHIQPKLIALYLSIPIVRGQIELGASGTSYSMQNIGQDVIKELPCVVIPNEEAIDLVQYLSTRLQHFSDILKKSELQIELLQERRIALISAAVTGQIDVREWQSNQTIVAE